MPANPTFSDTVLEKFHYPDLGTRTSKFVWLLEARFCLQLWGTFFCSTFPNGSTVASSQHRTNRALPVVDTNPHQPLVGSTNVSGGPSGFNTYRDEALAWRTAS